MSDDCQKKTKLVCFIKDYNDGRFTYLTDWSSHRTQSEYLCNNEGEGCSEVYVNWSSFMKNADDNIGDNEEGSQSRAEKSF